jgi:hypothetical protein
VTAIHGPDDPGLRTSRQPDATDPDLAPLPESDTLSVDTGDGSMADLQDARLGDASVEDSSLGDAGDHEAVEDGLQGPPDQGSALTARMSRRPRDMILSIGLLLVVVLGLFGLYRCLGGDEGVRVDPKPALAEARAAGAFPVLEPSGLRKGWTPVSAVYQPQDIGAVLRVGWRTPRKGSVQLIEGNLAPDILLERELGGAVAQPGTVDVNGKGWQIYPGRKGERALVLLEPGRTVMIVGRASEAELKELAASLR